MQSILHNIISDIGDIHQEYESYIMISKFGGIAGNLGVKCKLSTFNALRYEESF